jgi:hypothetical protein
LHDFFLQKFLFQFFFANFFKFQKFQQKTQTHVFNPLPKSSLTKNDPPHSVPQKKRKLAKKNSRHRSANKSGAKFAAGAPKNRLIVSIRFGLSVLLPDQLVVDFLQSKGLGLLGKSATMETWGLIGKNEQGVD